MKKTLFVISICLLMLSCNAFALQKLYSFVSLGYGRGWWGWVCVNEKGLKGVYGSPVNFCGARDCPFESAAVFGENNCRTADNAKFDEGSTDMNGLTYAEFGENTRISISEDLKLVSPDGTVVSDTICVGDKFKLEKGVNKGEYFNDGGNDDTPSVYWVDDVEALTKKILDYHEKNVLSCKDIGTNSLADTVDSLTGIPVVLNPGSRKYYGDITGRLVCSVKDRGINSGGFVKSGEYYSATSAGTFDFEATYSVECMYYYYGSPGYCMEGTSYYASNVIIRIPMVLQIRTLEPGENTVRVVLRQGAAEQVTNIPASSPDDPIYKYMSEVHNIVYNSIEDFFKIGDLSVKKTLKVVNPEKGSAQMDVVGADGIKYGSTANLRVIVKNTGESEITIKRLYATCDNKLLSCDSDKVPLGGTAECLISVTPKTGQKPVLILDYEYKSCGKTRTGTVPKTLMESKTVAPKASVQVYSVGVHEGCENNYYGCVPSDQEGNFIAGYECYNQNDKYYSAGKERFDLKYELPELTSKKILGASLVLSAGRVNRPQTLSLYSVNSDWALATCRAGGDICTQPYCGECKSLFELSGERVAETEAKSMGLLSFDISDSVKAAYASGNKVLSYQVRGEEDLWETGGVGSCGGVNAWSEQDVEAQGPGGSQPYLEIVYK